MVSSFSEFYKKQREALAANPVTPPSTSLPEYDFSGISFKRPPADNGPQSPLNWVIDTISRSLYGATTAVGGVAEGIAKAQETGNVGEVAKGLWEFLPNFSSGVMDMGFDEEGEFKGPGQDPNRKRTYGDLMEQYTDRFGKLNDPNYVDEQDNVNPWVKGVGGLALDILADPLTYVPGGVFITGAKGIARAGKAISSAVGDTVKGASKSGSVAKQTDEAAELAAAAAAKQAEEAAVTPTPKDDLEASDMLTPSPAPKAPEAPTPGGASQSAPVAVSKIEDAVTWARKSSDKVAQSAIKSYDNLLNGTKAPTPKQLAAAEAKILKAYEKSVKAGLPKGTASAAIVREVTEPGARSLRELMGESDNLPALRDGIGGLLASISRPMVNQKEVLSWARKHEKVPLKNLPKDMPPPPDFVSILGSNIPSVGRLAKIASSKELPQEVSTYAMRLLERIHRHATKAGPEDVTDAIVANLMRRADEEASVKALIGDDLFDTLSRVNSPDKLREHVKRINDFLNPELNRSAERFFNRNRTIGRAVFDRLGIPSPGLKPAANTAEEVVDTVRRIHDGTPLSIAVAEAAVKVLREQIPLDKTFREVYPYISGKVAFDSLDTTIRTGRIYRELNTFFQYSLIRSMTTVMDNYSLAKRGVKLSQMSGKGLARPKAYKEDWAEIGEELAGFFQTLGVRLHIGVDDATNALQPMAFTEVFEIVGKNFPAGNSELLTLYNGSTRVAPTVLMEAAHKVIMAGDDVTDAVLRKEIRDIITDPNKYGIKGTVNGEKVPNNIASQAAVSKFNKNSKSEVLVGRLTDALVASRAALVERAASNTAKWAERGGQEMAALSNKELNRISQILAEGTPAQAAKAVADIPKSVAQSADEIGAMPSSAAASVEVVEGAVGETAVSVAKAQVGIETAINAGKPVSKAVEEGTTKTFKATEKEVETAARAIDDGTGFDAVTPPPGAADDVATVADDIDTLKYNIGERTVVDPALGQQSFVKRMWNWTGDTFNHMKGMERIGQIKHAKGTVGTQIIDTRFAKPLRQLGKFDLDIQRAAVKAVQTGIENSNAEVMRAAAIVEDVMGTIFDTAKNGPKSLLNDKLLGVEKSLDHVNDVLAKWTRDIDPMQETFKFSGGDDLQSMLSQWQKWDFENPAQGLFRLGSAAVEITEHRAIVESFLSMGKAEGFVWQAAKSGDKIPAGYVKVVDSGGSNFGKMLPDNLYMQKEAAQELHRLDVLIDTSRELTGEFGELLRKYFLPGQSMWKMLTTIFRFGHHVRNFMSNSFMSFVDRGPQYWAKSQVDAARVLGMDNGYKGIDLVEILKSSDNKIPFANDTEVLFTTKAWGPITVGQMRDIAHRKGLMTTHAVSEDLMLQSGKGKMSDLNAALALSTPGRWAGNVSQYVDHHGKLSHAIQALRQEGAKGRNARWKNLSFEKAVDRVIRDVKRAHPDASMLTPRESKLRFLVPFYTWFAKTLPFAVESIIRNPARLSVMPKASYNWAVANGVNPNNLSDPFPEDQLFPSYITENAFGPQFVGPDGQYIGINPGVPHFDLLREIVHPLNMLTPAIKIPAEAATGSRFGGARINDMSDYVDQNVPFVNYLANISGVSPSGSILSILQGQGLDPQYQVERGNKTGFHQGMSALNWIFGMNAQDFSRPNLINYAEIEKRNRAAEEAKK